MASTMKLQDATKDSVSSLFTSLTTNTAKESAPAKTAPVEEKEVIQSVKARSFQDLNSPVYQSDKNSQPDIKTVTTEELDMTKVGVCFNVPRHVKDMWKSYFSAHGLTMTDGLIQSVQYLKEQEEKGEVKLGAISVLRK